MSLFGSSSSTPLFGSTGAAASPKPLFGAPAIAAAPSSSTQLFGSAPTATLGGGLPSSSTTTGLFGTSTTSAPSSSTLSLFGGPSTITTSAAPLFGSNANTVAATSAGSVLGSTLGTATTAGSTPLFGSATTSTAPLFGTPAKTTSTGASLFGAPSVVSSSNSLFGGTATSTAGTSLFAPSSTSATGAAITTSVGLGGTGQAAGTTTTSGTTTLGTISGPEKENVRDGEVPPPIVELTKQIKNKLKENRTLSDQIAVNSSDGAIRLKDKLKDIKHKTSDGVSQMGALNESVARLSQRSMRDLQLGKEASLVQETMAKHPHNMHSIGQQHTLRHIVEVIREYDSAIIQYQDMVQQLETRMADIMQGKASITTADLKVYLSRFEVMYSTVAEKLFEANNKVEEMKNQLIAEGTYSLPPTASSSTSENVWSDIKGSSSFPSQSTLAHLGSMLKPAQVGAPAATTGGGLFGSAPTGGSLFGSNTASKPLFGSTTPAGGSLFPSLAATTAQSTSLFPSITTAKPATSFGSTFSTNASGETNTATGNAGVRPVGESSGFWPDADFMFRLRQKNDQLGLPTGTGTQQVTDDGAPCPTKRPPEQKVIFIHRVVSDNYRPDMIFNQTATLMPPTLPQIATTPSSVGPPLDPLTAERLQSVLTSLYRLTGWMNYETALEKQMERMKTQR